MSDLALDCLVLAATMYALLVALVYNACKATPNLPQDRESANIIAYDDGPTIVTHKTRVNRELKAAFGDIPEDIQ